MRIYKYHRHYTNGCGIELQVNDILAHTFHNDDYFIITDNKGLVLNTIKTEEQFEDFKEAIRTSAERSFAWKPEKW